MGGMGRKLKRRKEEKNRKEWVYIKRGELDKLIKYSAALEAKCKRLEARIRENAPVINLGDRPVVDKPLGGE